MQKNAFGKQLHFTRRDDSFPLLFVQRLEFPEWLELEAHCSDVPATTFTLGRRRRVPRIDAA